MAGTTWPKVSPGQSPGHDQKATSRGLSPGRTERPCPVWTCPYRELGFDRHVGARALQERRERAALVGEPDALVERRLVGAGYDGARPRRPSRRSGGPGPAPRPSRSCTRPRAAPAGCRAWSARPRARWRSSRRERRRGAPRGSSRPPGCRYGSRSGYGQPAERAGAPRRKSRRRRVQGFLPIRRGRCARFSASALLGIGGGGPSG